MRIVFVAIWYDRTKVEARARARGWDGHEGLLDAYHPEEDPGACDQLECRDLESAVAHLRKIVAEGKEFWGQGIVRKFEVDGRRCRYCTCRGWRIVREYDVDETGIVGEHARDDCADDD